MPFLLLVDMSAAKPWSIGCVVQWFSARQRAGSGVGVSLVVSCSNVEATSTRVLLPTRERKSDWDYTLVFTAHLSSCVVQMSCR